MLWEMVGFDRPVISANCARVSCSVEERARATCSSVLVRTAVVADHAPTRSVLGSRDIPVILDRAFGFVMMQARIIHENEIRRHVDSWAFGRVPS